MAGEDISVLLEEKRIFKPKEEFVRQTNVNQWMDKHNFAGTEDFTGKMSINEIDNPAAYERVQFMKHFSGIE